MSLIEEIHDLLYSENKNDTIQKIEQIGDKEKLHIIAYNYNWNNGFEIPLSILKNKNCDMGTALMLFFNADGIRVLEDIKQVKESELKEWSKFILDLFNKINQEEFKSDEIKFKPDLSKVQIFKIKKKNPLLKNYFIEETGSKFVDIPVI